MDNEKTMVYYRIDSRDDGIGIMPTFGRYEEVDEWRKLVGIDDVETERYCTYYDKFYNTWKYIHGNDFDRVSALKKLPITIITEEQYLQALEIFHQLDILKTKQNMLLEELRKVGKEDK